MHRHECNTHNFLFDLKIKQGFFLYYISGKQNKSWKNFKIMIKSLFNYSIYSRPKIGNFRCDVIQFGVLRSRRRQQETKSLYPVWSVYELITSSNGHLGGFICRAWRDFVSVTYKKKMYRRPCVRMRPQDNLQKPTRETGNYSPFHPMFNIWENSLYAIENCNQRALCHRKLKLELIAIGCNFWWALCHCRYHRCYSAVS
jgi:hypothetical protein